MVDQRLDEGKAASTSLPPLVFTPIYRRYLWGGRRFASAFGRELPAGDDVAESWEIVDRGSDQSVVASGPLAGMSLGELVRDHGSALLGAQSQHAKFPLLFKFLDANQVLSVQVHPDDVRAARLSPPDRGKTEAWYVIDAEPGSRIYAGLRDGVGRADLAAAIRAGTCEALLHSFEPRPGDCVFIPAGTVHAIGAGLLVAEIQQSSDVTYRLFDWNRIGPDGQPRPLHVEAGVEAVTRFGPVDPVRRQPDVDPAMNRLVTCEFFVLDEVRPVGPWQVGGDGRLHVLAVLKGSVRLPDSWSLGSIGPGGCVLLPACLSNQAVATDAGTVLLRVSIP
jgi:mannose-6-phosphate isomerase